MQSKPFYLTRWRLAGWYAGVMALILSLGGLTVYRLIAHVHWVGMEQEMETVAEALQETVEPALQQPGKLDLSIQQLLPGICLVGTNCSTNQTVPPKGSLRVEQKILSRIEQGGYCMRLLDLANHPIALAQFPSSERPLCLEERFWQKLTDRKGNRYFQTSRIIYIQNRTAWGTLQLARSLEDIDTYLFSAQIILLLGVLLAIALIVAASWWLAGLAMQPIRQSYQQMQQFTADAAHELRTPLASLLAMTQAALKAKNLSGEDTQEVLQTIDRQGHRLSKLVQNLLLLCQLDQQKLLGKTDRCCLNSLLKGLIDDFEAMAIAADLSLTLNIRTTELLYVLGNEEQLYRCISNLIVNAIHYTPCGGSVALILEWHQPYAFVYVQDTGIGIAPDDQARIFNRFYRVSQERARRTGGTGLGLAIAQAIAKACNGSLHVNSELGKGSTFILRLPCTSEVNSQIDLTDQPRSKT